MADSNVDGEPAVGAWEHPSLYVHHLKEAISLTASNQSELFADSEIVAMKSFLNLDDASQCLFARMIMRQGPWLRTDKLGNCFPRWVRVQNDSEDFSTSSLLSSSLDSLRSAGYVTFLLATSHWSDGWRAMGSCCTVDEIKDVYYKLTLKKAKGNKETVLNNLYNHMSTSTDLFGRPLSLAKTLLATLAARGAADSKLKHSVQETKTPSVSLIVQINPDVCATFRRNQRLVQVPSLLSVYSHGRAATVRQPLPFNAAMLTLFGKIRFPLYRVNVSRPLFLSRRKFLQWEAAHEIKWAYHESSALAERALQCCSDEPHSHVKLTPLLNGQLNDVVNVIVESCNYFEVDETCPCRSSVRFVLERTSLLGSDDFKHTSAALYLPLAVSICVLSIWNSYSSEVGYFSRPKGEYDEYMNVVDAGAILASICCEIVEALEVEARRVSKPITGSTASGVDLLEERTALWWTPQQLVKFTGSDALLGAPEGVVCGAFSYELAIATLRSLIASPFLLHRRGKWVERLCIDLDHVGRRREALEECSKALSDRYLEGGHLLAIEKRHAVLSSKLSIASSAQDPNGSQAEYVGDGSGSDDDGFLGCPNSRNAPKKRKKRPRQSSSASKRLKSPPSGDIKQMSQTLSYAVEFLLQNARESSSSSLLHPSRTSTDTSDRFSDDDIAILSEHDYKVERGSRVIQNSVQISTSWACRVCTLLNEECLTVCIVCGSTKLKLGRPPKELKPATHFRYPSASSAKPNAINVTGLKNYFVALNSETITKKDSSGPGDRAPGEAILESVRSASHNLFPHEKTGSAKVNDVMTVELPLLSKTFDCPGNLPILSSLWGDTISPKNNWRPAVLELTGRRLGNKRQGKNLLVGVDGDAVVVEDLVLQMLGAEIRDEDESLHFWTDDGKVVSHPTGEYSLVPRYTGGRWEGWHCEGTPLRSLFGIIMWDILFLDTIENVFYTPYQDQPLDLQYGALFYKNRENEINAKLKWLSSAHMSDILGDIAKTYRNNYKRRCIGVSWVHPLHILQAIALCMHGCGLAAICKLLISNFRHFQGGAPDLLLIRAYRVKYANYGRNDQFKANENIEFVNINDWLGAQWRSLGREQVPPRRSWYGRTPVEQDEWNSLMDPLPPTRPATFNSSDEPGTDWDLTATSTLIRKNNRTDRSDSGDEDEMNKEVLLENLFEKSSDFLEATNPDVSEDKKFKAIFDQYTYSGPNLRSPDSFDSSSTIALQNGNEFIFPTAKIQIEAGDETYCWVDDWIFECLFVEVKGPTDRLAERQSVWLHALDSCRENFEASSVSGVSLVAASSTISTRSCYAPTAIVCQIREGRNGQDVGHHQSA